MEVVNGSTRVHSRLGGAPAVDKVCYHWRAGRCNRNPCQYLHSELPQATGSRMAPNRTHLLPAHGNFSGSVPSRKRISAYPGTDMQSSKKWVRGQNGKAGGGTMASHSTREKPNSAYPGTDMQSSKKWVRGQNGKVGGGSMAPYITQEKPDSACPRTDMQSSTKWVRGQNGKVGGGCTTSHTTQEKPISANPRTDTQSSTKLVRGQSGIVGEGSAAPRTNQEKLCNYWMAGNCTHGDACRYLHKWFSSGSFTMLSQLVGHEKVISGIAMPTGSDKLYSGSKDGSVRVWDCHTGQCAGVINLEGEIGCMISEGPWVFVGMPNIVKAWNTQNNADFSLSSSSGQVYALVVDNDGMLLAGTQDGSILAWKFSPATNNFELVASLKGHTSSVVSLIFGANRLYSGSMDCTIRVWDLETFQCLQTLTEHTSVVTSLLCWDQFLLSCSLDQTIKVWAATESGVIEVIYTHPQEHGLLTLCGIHDAEEKPVLICSRNNDSVVLYDLPSFKERGKIFARKEIRAIQIGQGGIFFTGDGAGELKVWKLS